MKRSEVINCPVKGERNNHHRISYLADGEEVSPQFEWLKNRDYLMTHGDANRIATYWQLHTDIPNFTSISMMEARKAEVLKRLESAVEKLKDAREEIREAVLVALKMKVAGDDIADRVIAAVAVFSDGN